MSFPPTVKWALSCWELTILVLSISESLLYQSLLSEQLTLLIIADLDQTASSHSSFSPPYRLAYY